MAIDVQLLLLRPRRDGDKKGSIGGKGGVYRKYRETTDGDGEHGRLYERVREA